MGRKNKSEKKEPTYCLSVSQIESLKQRAVREAVTESLTLMLAIPVMVLMDKHGFDREQLGDVATQIVEKFEAYQEGYFTLEDAQRVIREEAGTEIHLPDRDKRIF